MLINLFFPLFCLVDLAPILASQHVIRFLKRFELTQQDMCPGLVNVVLLAKLQDKVSALS